MKRLSLLVVALMAGCQLAEQAEPVKEATPAATSSAVVAAPANAYGVDQIVDYYMENETRGKDWLVGRQVLISGHISLIKDGDNGEFYVFLTGSAEQRTSNIIVVRYEPALRTQAYGLAVGQVKTFTAVFYKRQDYDALLFNGVSL